MICWKGSYSTSRTYLQKAKSPQQAHQAKGTAILIKQLTRQAQALPENKSNPWSATMKSTTTNKFWESSPIRSKRLIKALTAAQSTLQTTRYPTARRRCMSSSLRSQTWKQAATPRRTRSRKKWGRGRRERSRGIQTLPWTRRAQAKSVSSLPGRIKMGASSAILIRQTKILILANNTARLVCFHWDWWWSCVVCPLRLWLMSHLRALLETCREVSLKRTIREDSCIRLTIKFYTRVPTQITTRPVLQMN